MFEMSSIARKEVEWNEVDTAVAATISYFYIHPSVSCRQRPKRFCALITILSTTCIMEKE